jgi:hypothetical protein
MLSGQAQKPRNRRKKEKRRRKPTTTKPEIILSHALLNKVVPAMRN